MLSVVTIGNENNMRAWLSKNFSHISYEIHGNFTDFNEAVQAIFSLNVDCVIMDISMSIINGLQLIKSLGNQYFSIAVIFAGSDYDPDSFFAEFRYDNLGFQFQVLDQSSFFERVDHIVTENSTDLIDERGLDETDDRVIHLIKGIIDNEFKGHISLDEISKRVFFTPQYLGKYFKRKAGMTITEYLQRTRIDQAKKLLREDSAIKIHEVAALVGYDEHSMYFHKLFKKMEGVTPRDYQTKNKSN